MKFEFVSAMDRREELIPLFEEYARMLVETDPVFTVSLEQQHYDEEIARLEEKYSSPRGRIYLLCIDGAPAGCVGMKESDADHAELKRLYLRPEFRGHGLGEIMIQKIMADAKDAGYRWLRLDTLPGLKTALALYRRMGFYEIPAYYDCPVPDTVFMEIAL